MQKAGPALDGAKVKKLLEKKTRFSCGKNSHLSRNCSMKVAAMVGDKASSCGTLGYHMKETYLEIQVNEL